MKSVYKKLFFCVGIAFILVGVIVLINPVVSDVALTSDTGASHYYWQLPNRNGLIMAFVWLLFIIQLVGNYYLIRARLKDPSHKFTSGNRNILIFNLVMIIIHYLESIVYYDGLAQDVSVYSSQYSVILVLVVILLMQSVSRGIIFGKKLDIDGSVMKLIYAIHGFIFTFSIVYTFWYHPVVNTIGHLFGFFYMFLLFIQIGFIKTQVHYNKKWIVLLEVLVAFHGASVAYFVQNSTLWAMFFFGFGFIFVFTQIYGLTSNKRIVYSSWIAYAILVLTYYGTTDITNIHQILWIPIIEYLHVLVFYLIIKIYTKHKKKIHT